MTHARADQERNSRTAAERNNIRKYISKKLQLSLRGEIFYDCKRRIRKVSSRM